MSSPIQIRNTIPIQQTTQRSEQEKKLREAAQMYERHFLNEMVRAMRKTVPEGEGIIQSSFAQKLYTDQLDDQYVDSWTKQGGVGLGELVFQQLKERVLGPDTFMLPPQGPVPVPGAVKPLATPTPIPADETLPLPIQGATLLIESSSGAQTTADREVTSPWSGTVQQSFLSPEGRVMLKINHSEDVESILNYKGSIVDLEQGQTLEAGQRVGQMDFETKGLVWSVTKKGQKGA